MIVSRRKTVVSNQSISHSIYGKTVEILSVEDNEDEASLTIETLQEGRVRNNVTLAVDDVESMTFLRREGKYATAPRPDLILLDMKLPRKSDHEVLAEIKGDTDLKRIPVVTRSKFSAEDDIVESCDQHANCYVENPLDLDEFILAVRRIEVLWISFVRLPAA